MSFVGEATLSALFEALFSKLASSESLFLTTEKQGYKELKKWEKVLRNIQAVLDDAEEKQMKDRQVKLWLAELQDLAYDVDDILDEFATEAALRSKLKKEHQTSRSKVRKIIYTFTTNLNPNAFILSYKMMSKMNLITVRLQDLATQRSNFQFRENDVGRPEIIIERPPTTSLVNEALVCGREDDKKAIIDLLLKDNSTDGKVSVIPVVGIGGIGKTTIAQLVYNDNSIKDHFDIKAWVCVSEDFDMIRITKTILQSITSEACNELNDLTLLQVKLKEKLSKENFLLVLDDIWNDCYNDWMILRSPFEVGSARSKIIVTTRSQNVSSIMKTVPDYSLTILSDDDCLFILTQHALGTKDFSGHSDLKEIGEQIVKKCKGLPLAAKTIGGSLRATVDPDAWKDVLENEIWNLSQEKCGIIPALWLSYYHLPPHLKRCFSYCSILPKDYEFGEEEIVLLWMAEGLLQQANTRRQIENLGSMYFQDLVSRSFFQVSSRDKTRFVMHDLVNDLAQFVAGETCFRVEGGRQLQISSRARHSSYIGNRYNGFKKFNTFYEAENLRTFMSFMLPKDGVCFLANNVLLDLLLKLKHLRVLSLEGYYITEIPNSVGDLRHLRYLNFSYTKVKTLPNSICALINLQTLLLRGCDRLKQLPADLRHLINLRHLDIVDANSIQRMPFGIGELIDLQSLSNFVVGQSLGYQIRELKNLSDLKGQLSISGLQNLVNDQDALEARLFEKSSLDELEMKWNEDLKDDSRNGAVEKEVLSFLQPNQKLKKLSIKYYVGFTFPTWMGDPSFKSLISLNFEYCLKCTSLPSLGKLPFLKALIIKGMSSVKRVGVEFYGENCTDAFQSLEILHFEDMPELKEWNHYQLDNQTRNFSCLRHLSVKKCPKLVGSLPIYLPCLEKMVIHECQLLVVSTPNPSKLCELEIVGSKEVLQECSSNLCSLKKVCLSNITKFTCLTNGLMVGSTKVEFLRIAGCGELTSLWQNKGEWLAQLRFLRNLEILNCPQLVSMEIGEGKEELLQIETLCNLEYIRIKYCERLEKLSTALHNLTSLRELEIVKCPKLVSFTHKNLPATLKGLLVKNCENLQCLLEGEESIKTSSRSLLTHLIIERCPSLLSLSSSGELPARLQHLKIWSCSKLTYLSLSGRLPAGLKYLRIDLCQMLECIAHSVQNNTCLEFIFIGRCEKIQYLPDGLEKLSHLQQIQLECMRNLISIPRLPSASLQVLRLSWCRKLEAVPNGIHILTSLQELEISNCPCSFPEEGFPTNLTSLTISKPEILEGLIKWGFYKLTSLERLTIRGGYSDGVSFPHEEKGMVLPCSLRKLAISNFQNVEFLSSMGFQNLPSLECLCIVNFPKLKSLPRKEMLLSLLELYIHDCPWLKQRCRKDEGEDWSSIAHIPFVQIDNRFIYDSEEENEESDSE